MFQNANLEANNLRMSPIDAPKGRKKRSDANETRMSDVKVTTDADELYIAVLFCFTNGIQIENLLFYREPCEPKHQCFQYFHQNSISKETYFSLSK